MRQQSSGSVCALLDEAARILAAHGLDSARLDAEVLLGQVLQRSRTWLYTWPEHIVDGGDAARFHALVERRRCHEPIAYLVGSKAFYDLELQVSAATLIPRPETELLVDAALTWLRAHPEAGSRDLRVLDLCTGSGAIATVLAHAHGPCTVVATDISADALDVARANAARHGVGGRIDWRQGDLWSVVDPAERFDLIVSNPPYIDPSELSELEPEVRDHEPHLALFAGDGGLALVSAIVERAWTLLSSPGALAIEIGASQGARALDRMDRLPYHSVMVKQDASGRDRLLWGELGPHMQGPPTHSSSPGRRAR